MTSTFVLAFLFIAIACGAVAHGIGWLIDTVRVWFVRRTFLKGQTSHGDPARVHRETDRGMDRLAVRSRMVPIPDRDRYRYRLDDASGLSDHAAGRPRASESLLGAVPRGISADAVDAGAGQHYRGDASITAAARGPQGVN